MTLLAGANGTWINQFAFPAINIFKERIKAIDYVVIKYGHSFIPYERACADAKIPWLGERMGESGAGSQNGPSLATIYANQLADQVDQPGCIGGVINLEEADGGWHEDDGSSTRLLIETFKTRHPNKPLFASLDTRANRPNDPYQRVCAELCDGVMPMVYPGAFQLPTRLSFDICITPLLRTYWSGKDILPTFQVYPAPGLDIGEEVQVVNDLFAAGLIQGASSYTMGHADQAEWDTSLGFNPQVPQNIPPAIDLIAALAQLQAAWKTGWTAIAERGTVQEAVAYATFWKNLTGN